MDTPTTERIENRRSGFVTHFLSADDSYLELVARDLALNCDTMTISRFIRPLFVSLGREPTVAELYFCVEAINSGKRLDDSVRIGSVISSLPALSSLTYDLVERCSATMSDPRAYISLKQLFKFAANGGMQASRSATFISLMRNNTPTLPVQAFAQPSFAVTYRYTLCHARFLPHGCPRRNEIVVLLSARNGTTAAGCASAVAAFSESSVLHNIPFSYFPLSHRGLMRDLLASFSGAHIDISALPGSPVYPESAYSCYAGGALITVERGDVPPLCDIAVNSGLDFSAPVSFMPPYNIFTSGSPSGGASVSFKRTFLRALESIRLYDLRCQPSPSPEYKNIRILSSNIPNTEVFAYSLSGGNIYDVLSGIIDSADDYAVAGTLCPDAPDTLPSAVALDAFVSNYSHPAAATCFTIGERTEFTIFILKYR